MPSLSRPYGQLLRPTQAEVNAAIRRLVDESAGGQQGEERDQEQRAETYWRLLILWAEATRPETLMTAVRLPGHSVSDIRTRVRTRCPRTHRPLR
ncbi:hypothetical protein [Streptomyces sp. NP-1717]|uniref:hypothetical protein n=1 Tax=Streptomyces sp. NP-1717 TaxID=2704470 RepID=UPI001F5D4899|nr:hypothetical protein [Streptomyces sp. NP-1717]MCI3221994.1 hypothetical protein [Streptomyces sp. NP-1717]